MVTRKEWVLGHMFGKIVDLGCGDGDVLREKASLVTGVDMSMRSPGYKFVQADAAKTPFADKEFDTAFMGELLQSVPDPVKVLREARRISRIQVFTVPYEYNWDTAFLPFHNASAVRYYTLDMLCEDFEKAELSYKIEMIQYDGWSFLVGVLK